MEHVSGIVDKLRDNPIGIVGLAMLILGFLAYVYFQKEKDWRVKFGSLAFVAVGLGLAVWTIVPEPRPVPPQPVVDRCDGVDTELVRGNAVFTAHWCGTTGATRSTKLQAIFDPTPSFKAYAEKPYADLSQNELYAEARRLAKEGKDDEAFERIDACQCHNPTSQALVREGKLKVICHLAKS